MGSIGFAEIAVIAVIALLVLGPDRLPGAARQVGQALAQLRNMSSGVRKDLEDAMDSTDLRQTFNEIKGTVDELNPRRVIADAMGSSAFTMASGDTVTVDSTSGSVSTISKVGAPQTIPAPDADTIAAPSQLAGPGPVVEESTAYDPFLKSFPAILPKEVASAPQSAGGRFVDILVDQPSAVSEVQQ